ncbi:AGE family epimerase/isomerase [Persicobacter diffluens]|uniref:Uncharacterized protein n=1 Tax=Persicobacter diffluens TaxID=981 RepID=A0AAN5AN65_9BACT|nr:hypothetical protein PEDI_50490 [Persicobacter diffluens]
MRKIISILCLLFFYHTGFSQYQLIAEHLKNPDKNIDFVKGVADFHIKLEDKNLGGYHTFAGLDGHAKADQSGGWEGFQYKSLCATSRTAYAFARAFQMTGDIKYLQHARKALDFLYDKGWDQQNDGWFFTYDTDNDQSFGTPWAQNERWIFQQEYAMVGIVAMEEALGGTPFESNGIAIEQEFIDKSLQNLDENWWDSRDNYLGFYEKGSIRNSGQKGKGFTGTIDGINTHAALLANSYRTPETIQRFKDLSDIARDHLAGSMELTAVKAGFPEIFDSNWNIDQSNDHCGVGHVLKTAWCLGRAAVFFRNASYQTAAEQLLDQVLERNNHEHEDLYDYHYGAPFSDISWKTGKRKNATKNHWVLEQGLTGGLMNYYSTVDDQKREKYLQLADESMAFFEQHLLSAHGVSYMNVSQDGSQPFGDLLANTFKAGFHDAELGYMTYLYANTYLHARPFSLYYHFDGQTTEQVQLAPVIVKKDGLSIASITLNGEPYTDFDAQAMTVNLDESTSGIFKVTYQPNSNPLDPQTPLLAEKTQNFEVYPTIFNEQLTIEGKGIQQAGLFSISGKKVGHYHLDPSLDQQKLQLNTLATGMYLLRLDGINQQTQMIKLLKQR